MMDQLDSANDNENICTRLWHKYNQRVQRILDFLTPQHIIRWIIIVALLIYFLYRVIYYQGFYIIAYVLGIFLLNQFILFLTPMVIQEDDLEEDDGPSLPTRSDEEFRPFMRRLPEFKFWYTTFKSVVISIICTFFELFDIPVFWPILVMYFITLFLVTMRRQIQHMIKHRYLPFSYGKIRYQGKTESNNLNSVKKNAK
jgi:hypothetical protein